MNSESISVKVATGESPLPESGDRGAEAPGRLGYISAFLISLPLFGVGYVIDQTVRWTDHLTGLYNGLFHMGIFCLAWGVYMVPWVLIVYLFYRKRETQTLRTLWIIGPSVLMSLITLSGLVTDPPTPNHRFKRFAKTELPKDLSDLNALFSGGGLADFSDLYYFKSSSAEIERIIREMKLTEDEFYGNRKTSHTVISRLSGSPDFTEWKGAKQYRGDDGKDHWFYYLITDSAKTQAYIFVGCT